MKRIKFNPAWIVFTCLAFWAAFLLLLVSPSLVDGNNATFAILPFTLSIAALLTLPSVFVIFRGYSNTDSREARLTNSPVPKVIASLILSLIAISIYTAIKSLWIAPGDMEENKFVYENIATSTSFASIILVFILSALQKDIYWVTRKKTAILDERQTIERQQVFEDSYKIGTFLVLITALVFAATIDNIQQIIALSTFHRVPGHISLLPFNIVITLFALPLILAAFKKRR
jgi:hypothetical protein